MRRGAILVVAMQVIKALEINLDPITLIMIADLRTDALSRLGVSPAAIRACDKWWEDVRTDCVCFRFQTDEPGSIMPEWAGWWAPVHVWYDYMPGSRADELNAYFPDGPSKIDDPAPVIRVRMVSLEG